MNPADVRYGVCILHPLEAVKDPLDERALDVKGRQQRALEGLKTWLGAAAKEEPLNCGARRRRAARSASPVSGMFRGTEPGRRVRVDV